MYRDLVLEYKDDPENKGDLFSITDELFLSKYFKKMVGKKWTKKFKEALEPGEAWVIYRFNGKVIRINLMQMPEL